MIFSWLQTLTNMSQFPTKFLAPPIRLITINGMSLKIVKLSKDSTRQEL